MFAPQNCFSETNNSAFTNYAKMKCRCGLEAALKISSSGRKYLGCSRRAASGQCEFTRMLPDSAQESASPTHSPNMNHMEEVSNRSRNENIDPTFTTPPTGLNPMKRTPPTMENEDCPLLLPSQKRAKIIAEVLRETSLSASQKQLTPMPKTLCRSDSHPHSENGAIPTAFPESIPALLNDFSGNTPEGPDTKYQDVRPETIVLSNHSSQSIGSSSGKMNPPSSDGVPSSRAVNTDKTWLLHTPKRTEFERSASLTSVLSSPEQSPVKGKHRANEEWRKEKPAVISSEESPSKKRYSATSVTQTLEGLSGLPNYLRTFEKDQEIKDMKIKHLENEVQRLKSRQSELETLLQMYEQHSSITRHDA